MNNKLKFLSKISLGFRSSFNLNIFQKTTLLFAIEGVLIALVNNLIMNNNNLFATRMGASDLQISLVVALPQFVGMVVLIPGGILTDRLVNKRKMVIISLLMVAGAYSIIGFSPMFGKNRLIIFILLLSVSFGPMTMYIASWQAYFSDVVNIEDRNTTLTLRTMGTFLINILIPLFTGLLLASESSIENKLKIHQLFFWIASFLIFLQIFVLRKINGGNVKNQGNITFIEVKNGVIELSKNKRFVSFVGVALFFYLTWQSDWALYFIGQKKYLKLDELWLSAVIIGGATIQFLTIGFWSRMNEKFGIRLPIIMGSLGLAFCPISMIIGTSLPIKSGQVVFLIANTLSNIAFASVMLNVIQCLLQVVPEKNKTLSISVYTALVTFSNAVMPIVGVMVYTAFGSTLYALHATFWLIFAFRLVATGFWTLRWWLLRNE